MMWIDGKKGGFWGEGLGELAPVVRSGTTRGEKEKGTAP